MCRHPTNTSDNSDSDDEDDSSDIGSERTAPVTFVLFGTQECVLEDPNVVDEVDNMMSSIGMGQVSAKASSALFSAKAWFTGKKRTDLFI